MNWSELSEKQKGAIKRAYEGGKEPADIAPGYGLKPKQVSDQAYRKNWKKVASKKRPAARKKSAKGKPKAKATARKKPAAQKKGKRPAAARRGAKKATRPARRR